MNWVFAWDGDVEIKAGKMESAAVLVEGEVSEFLCLLERGM